MEIRGKTVLVTGASSGIGAAAVVALARAGARVGAMARRGDRLRGLVETVASQGGQALALEGDVTQRGQVQAAVEELERWGGAVSGVVSNAGFLGPRVAVLGYPEAALRESLEVNVLGTFHLLQATLPSLLRQPSAFFLAMSSYLGRHALPDCAGYVAGKFGLEGLVRAAAAEHQGSGLALVTLAPGMVATDMLADYLGTRDLGKYSAPEAVASALLRLLSDLDASQSGAALDIQPWMESP
jgi:hypothetical protein